MSIKSKIKNSRVTIALINASRKLFRKNKFRIKKGNSVKIEGLIHGTDITVNGVGNVVEIIKPKAIKDLKIFINGNNNRVQIDEGCILNGLICWIEDDNGSISVGEGSMICGQTQLSVIEGTRIKVGKDCMFSSGIYVSAGDSHSILDENGKRINPSLDIEIRDHVWVGYHTTILKGVVVEKNSIVGARSVVTKSFGREGVILAGSPAKVVKENINWDKARLPIEENYGK